MSLRSSNETRIIADKPAGCVGWILAGGKSTRMHGQNKALALVNGKTLIQAVAENVHPQVDQLIISSGAHSYTTLSISFPVHFIADSGLLGPLEGIHKGLEYLSNSGFEWLATCPCDTPFMPLDWIRRLTRVQTQEPIGATYVQYGAHNHYAHALWHRSHLSTVEKLLNRGERSLHRALKSCNANAVTIEPLEIKRRQHFFTNINSPEDLGQYRWKS